jgi:multiple sugar transport system permease protein
MTPFLKVALRTAALALSSGAISVFTSAMVGYGFARFRVPGQKFLFWFVVALLIVPGITLRIPRFIMYSRLGLINTYAPWFLGALGSSAYFVFMFRQFFYALPEELAEAAEMDGCNPLRTFLQVYFPNARPILATALIFSFTGVWGDYIGPLMYLSDRNTLLAVKLATAFVDPRGNALPTVTLAANVVYLVPLIVLFFINQRYIMQGVVTSGLKG